MRQLINGPKDSTKLWPGRKVPFCIDDSIPSSFLPAIQKAMIDIQRSTCIRFEQLSVPSSIDHVKITRQGGCWSDVGRRGGQQLLSLDIDCFDERDVFHELIHTLGFWHEHNRADRDRYVRVLKENIDSAHITDFKKKSGHVSETSDVPYDHYSVMHYKSDQFSRDGKSPTMVPLNKNVRIEDLGSASYPTSKDIEKINILYHCGATECKKPLLGEHVVMKGNDFRIGSAIEFACEFRHMQLIGSIRRVCQPNGIYSGHRPRCVSKIQHYCNFENGLCGWYSLIGADQPSDNGPWTLSNGFNYREGTGPVVDFTTGQMTGHFLLLDSTNLDPSFRAFLRSPIISTDEFAQYCMTFGYHMWGADVGSLIVSIINDSGTKELLRVFGNQGTQWKLKKLVFAVRSDFQVQFEGTILSDSGDIALDDIAIETGSC